MVIIQAILYVAHGSRLKEGVEEARAFMQEQMKRIDVPIQIISFIELQRPFVHEGIVQCIIRGATHIAVVPILLLEAGHAKHDLPHVIERAQEKYPHVTFTYGRPFGVHESIINTLVKRMEEQQKITRDARVLIVGRGSTDPSILADFQQIISLLQEKIDVSSIHVCYLAVQQPTFIDGLHREINSEAKTVFIVPYLLFTGLLMLHIEKKAQELQRPNQQLIVCNPIGSNEDISKLFLERVNQILNTKEALL